MPIKPIDLCAETSPTLRHVVASPALSARGNLRCRGAARGLPSPSGRKTRPYGLACCAHLVIGAKRSVRGSCPLAFAESLAQAGQGLARLLESPARQALAGGLASFRPDSSPR